MPIRLIEEDERLTFVYEDAKLFYKRMPHDKKAMLLQKCTEIKKKVEVIDNAKFMRELLKRTVIGWEGFVDSDGPVDFSHEALMTIPEAVVLAFVEHMDDEGNEEEEHHRKN